MSESEQDKAPEESAAGEGSASDRADRVETPAAWPAPGEAPGGSRPAGADRAHPPNQTGGAELEDDVMGARPEPSESAVSEEAGEEADAVVDAPAEAQPGEKGQEDDPDMKDMAVGPRPADDQAAE
jgi:hypothetical protein